MDNRIISDLKSSYGITFNEATPVTGGLMNLKWKVSIGDKELLIKQFSIERYNLEYLKQIEKSLQRQIILKQYGVACPYIWQYEGHAIRFLDDVTAYMVMDFHSGHIESPQTITIRQMYSLGDACGLMHKEFQKLPEHLKADKYYPITGKQTLANLWKHYNDSRQTDEFKTMSEFNKAVLALEHILNKLDAAYLDSLPKGIAHEDFSPDNMLFHDDCISVILDFDRSKYNYLWHDIGRAILSFTLKDNRINTDKVKAFVEGYSKHMKQTLPDIADALRVAWCVEVPWWIQPKFFGDNHAKVIRFKDEMLWLTEHFNELDSILGL